MGACMCILLHMCMDLCVCIFVCRYVCILIRINYQLILVYMCSGHSIVCRWKRKIECTDVKIHEVFSTCATSFPLLNFASLWAQALNNVMGGVFGVISLEMQISHLFHDDALMTRGRPKFVPQLHSVYLVLIWTHLPQRACVNATSKQFAIIVDSKFRQRIKRYCKCLGIVSSVEKTCEGCATSPSAIFFYQCCISICRILGVRQVHL